jgi:spectinomycin phosphotransferase
MLDRPPLTDTAIAAALRDHYGIETTTLEFLALGHDANAWTVRGRGGSQNAEDVFVKIRRAIDPARLSAIRFLKDSGLDEAVAPLATHHGDLSTQLDGLFLVVYPFLDAPIAADAGLTDEQWVAYGDVVGRLHRTVLPRAIRDALPAEDFVPKAFAGLGPVQAAVDEDASDDPTRREQAAQWRAHQAEIDAVVRLATKLSAVLRERVGEADASAATFVPCHGDVHTHNVLVDPSGSLHVVDWDELSMAPPERDLMFVLGSPIGLAPGEREAGLFLRGYGPIEVDPVRLAYYHADWAIQDLVGHAERVLVTDFGPASRAEALRIFDSIFDPGGEVEVALARGADF